MHCRQPVHIYPYCCTTNISSTSVRIPSTEFLNPTCFQVKGTHLNNVLTAINPFIYIILTLKGCRGSMYNISTQFLKTSPSLKSIFYFTWDYDFYLVHSLMSRIKLKNILLCDIDDQNTRYEVVSKGTHAV